KRTNDFLKALEDYGFTKEQVREIVIKFPQVLSCTAERTNSILANFKKYGFTKEQVRDIVIKHPTALSYTVKRTNDFLKALEDYGFTKEEIKSNIVLANPQILRTSGPDVRLRLANLEKRRESLCGKLVLELNKDEVKKMVIRMPSLLGFTEETMDKKLKLRMFIAHVCETDILPQDRRFTTVLMTGRRTLVTRVAYARRNNINWRDEKYLYMSKTRFEKKFGIRI
ncbi:MAG: hypothetical protein ACPL06_00555, partial [Candidatus Anstonellales archaeon]